MVGVGAAAAVSTHRIWVSFPISSSGNGILIPGFGFPCKFPCPSLDANAKFPSLSSSFSPLLRSKNAPTHFVPKASSLVGRAEFVEEPATKVTFQNPQSLPGCSSIFTLLGTGHREKVFAIIGVKVYAAGFYVNESILSTLDEYKGQSAAGIQASLALFNSIFNAPFEKSLQIVLVRDVDGKTFWDALDEAISPRLNAPTPTDNSALSTFRSIFQGQTLNKGTIILLTWTNTSTMLVSVSSNEFPSDVEAKVESNGVISALFDVFFGNPPVSPTLKASVADTLATRLK